MLLHCMHKFFTTVWQQEAIPSELKDSLIVTIFKKGDKTACGNYGGISLLSITGKLLAQILLNRLLPIAENILP